MKNVVKCLIVNKKNEILLIKRGKNDTHANYWETAGGGIDCEESYEEACIREVLEETGLSIKKPLFIKTIIRLDSITGEKFKISLFKKMIMDDLKVDLSDNPDHSDFKWFSLADIKNIEIDSWTLEQLKAHSFL